MRTTLQLFAVTFLLMFSCQSNENENSTTSLEIVQKEEPQLVVQPIQMKQESVIDRPFDNIDIPFQSFNYSNSNGSIIDIKTGSQIKIPKGAFVDKNGNAVTKNIKIEYREFHDIGDIMLSGIKMTYEDEKQSGDFESAGMFEIRAFSNNEELSLKAGKEIDVEMASFKSGDFNSYTMNEETAEWEYIEKSKAEKNNRKSEKLAALDEEESNLEVVCEMVPRELQEGEEAFDLDFSLNRHHELKLFSGAMWFVNGGIKEVNRFKKDRNSYNELSIEPGDSCGIFTLSLWNRTDAFSNKNKSTYSVTPAWKGKEHKRIKKDFKQNMEAFKTKAKELAAQRRAVEREADLVRGFRLKGMGIFNCDKVFDYVKVVTVGLVISCKEKIKNWWYITQNKKVAIKYYNPTVTNFKYNPNSTNSVMAVLPNDKIGIVTEEAFQSAYDAFRLSEDPNKKLELEIEIEPEPVAEKKEFKKHISKF
jgi:hypothetical protein